MKHKILHDMASIHWPCPKRNVVVHSMKCFLGISVA